MAYPKRKHPRLKEYDYSLPGYYYVTIHSANDGFRLSHVVLNPVSKEAEIHLTAAGQIAEEQMWDLERRYRNVHVDRYVIMPNHIHLILNITEQTAGASPRPTLMDIIGAFKSLTTRGCNQTFQTPGRKLFQQSFYETVLRNEKAYQECCRYLQDNPAKWLLNPEE